MGTILEDMNGYFNLSDKKGENFYIFSHEKVWHRRQRKYLAQEKETAGKKIQRNSISLMQINFDFINKNEM